MESELKTRKPLLSRYTQLEYQAVLDVRPHHLPYVADCCLRQLLSHENHRTRELYDLKGMDQHNSEGEKIGEEISYIEGIIRLDDNEKGAPFSAKLESAFDAFSGQSHILHTLKSTRSLSLPDYVPDHLIGYSLGIEITALRFALEFFSSRFTTSSFGYSPMVTESFSLSTDQNVLSLSISSEFRKGSAALPLCRDDTLIRLSEVLNLACGENLLQDLKIKMKLP